MGFISFIIGFLVGAESCAHIFTSYRWVWNIEFHILPLFISGQHHDCQFSLFPLRISEVWRDLNLSQGMGHTKVWDMEQSRSWEHQTPAPVAEELWLLHCNADTLPLSTGRKIVGKGHLHGSWFKKKNQPKYHQKLCLNLHLRISIWCSNTLHLPQGPENANPAYQGCYQLLNFRRQTV